MISRVPLALLAALVLIGDLAVVARSDHAPGGPTASVTEQVVTPRATPATESLDEQLARVTDAVQQLRELRFPATPLVRYLSPEDLAADVESQLDGYTEAQADLDRELLVMLGQLAPGTDLRALLITAYGEQVAGYYDPATSELVVGTESQDERVGRFDELTLAHELAHSLVDATVGLPDFEAMDAQDADAQLAAQAMVEGDASSLMSLYAQEAFSAVDQFFLAQEALSLADTLASFDALPHAIRRQLAFPYQEGLAFVDALRDQGGWAAVDAAYAAPPATTLEILDPSLYGRVRTVDPPAFGQLDNGWTQDRTLSFGALDVLILLEGPGGETSRGNPAALSIATTWQGGRIRQWSRAEDTTAALHLQVREEPGYCEVFIDWYLAAFPESAQVEAPRGTQAAFTSSGQSMVAACNGGGVRIGIAPDVTTAARAIDG